MAKKFERIGQNYVLFFGKGHAKGFYSQSHPKDIMKAIQHRCDVTYDGKQTRITIIPYKQEGRQVKFKLNYHDLPRAIAAQKIFDTLVKERIITDIRLSRYTVFVRNSNSITVDKKSYTFNSDKKFDEVFMEVKEFFKEQQEKAKEEIQISNANTPPSSHTLIVARSGTKARSQKPAKCFSISIPNTSSKEITDMMRNA